MGSRRTAWHVLLAMHLRERAPGDFEVRVEIPVSVEPLRGDFLLLRQTPRVGAKQAATLRQLWSALPKDSIVEFKSVGRPYRARNIDRLLAYLHVYFADETERLNGRQDLARVLLIPRRTQALDVDIEAHGLRFVDARHGYWRLEGSPFPLWVIELSAVAGAERDDVLRWFGTGSAESASVRRWVAAKVGTKEIAMEELEDFDDIMRLFVQKLPPATVVGAFPPEVILGAYSPEQRLAGLDPEQRLAGLDPAERLLALPDDALRALTDAYVDGLPEPTRSLIRARRRS